MSGYTDDGEGFNAAPASQDRAAERSQGVGRRIRGMVLADMETAGARGTTCHEAEDRLGVSHESYTGARTALHRDPVSGVVRLKERRDRRHVYVLAEYVQDRETVPFKPNTRRVPSEVRNAVTTIESWAANQRFGGMLVVAPDWEALDVITTHLRGTS